MYLTSSGVNSNLTNFLSFFYFYFFIHVPFFFSVVNFSRFFSRPSLQSSYPFFPPEKYDLKIFVSLNVCVQNMRYFLRI